MLGIRFFVVYLEVLTIAKLDHQLNEEIRDKEIRLIGDDGAQLGIMSAAQANAMAEEQGLDLVKISPNATPPVCKIMDYSKFCYDQKKREKDAKKNQRVVEIKEIRMSPSIDTNDFNTKVKAAQKFLTDGNRVKVSVRFRGREMAHTNLGEKLLMDFADGGNGVGRDLDQIHALLLSQGVGLCRGHDTQLGTVGTDQTNLLVANLLIELMI